MQIEPGRRYSKRVSEAGRASPPVVVAGLQDDYVVLLDEIDESVLVVGQQSPTGTGRSGGRRPDATARRDGVRCHR